MRARKHIHNAQSNFMGQHEMVLLFTKRAFASKVAVFISPSDKHALPNILSSAKYLSPSSVSIYHSTSTTHTPSSLVDIQKKEQFTHWITTHCSVGKTLFPQFVANFDNSFAIVSDVIKIENEHTFKRPIYAGTQHVASFLIFFVYSTFVPY